MFVVYPTSRIVHRTIKSWSNIKCSQPVVSILTRLSKPSAFNFVTEATAATRFFHILEITIFVFPPQRSAAVAQRPSITLPSPPLARSSTTLSLVICAIPAIDSTSGEHMMTFTAMRKACGSRNRRLYIVQVRIECF